MDPPSTISLGLDLGKDGGWRDMEIMFMYKVLNFNTTIGLHQGVYSNNYMQELLLLLWNIGPKNNGVGIGDIIIYISSNTYIIKYILSYHQIYIVISNIYCHIIKYIYIEQSIFKLFLYFYLIYSSSIFSFN